MLMNWSKFRWGFLEAALQRRLQGPSVLRMHRRTRVHYNMLPVRWCNHLEQQLGRFAVVKLINLGKLKFRLGLGKSKRMYEKNLQRLFE